MRDGGVYSLHTSCKLRWSSCDNFGGYHLIHDYISYGLCASAVPLFLLISGYLYFKGCEVQYKWKDYLEKNKKRFRTLVIPYLIWNVFILLLFLSAQSLMPNMMSGKHTPIMEYSLFDWIMAFWDAGEGFPINGPMWFIRDLIVLSVLSLLIYPLIKNKWIGLAVVIVSFSLGVKDIYFILGAWLYIHGIDFVKYCKRIKWISLSGYLILVGVNMTIVGTIHDIISSIHVFWGVVAITGFVGYIYENRKLERSMLFLSGTTFFIYAFHQQPLLLLCKIWKKMCPNSDIMDIMGYFILPFAIIIISIVLYVMLKRIAPRALAIMTGGR